MSAAIVWFRRDLRLADNPALDAAIASGKKLLLVYIHAATEHAPWAPGAAQMSWLHHSLERLHQSLQSRGQRLCFFNGASAETLKRLISEAGAQAIFWNRCYEPALVQRDHALKTELKALGVEVNSFNGALLHEPWEIKTGSGTPYRVFSPYWRKCRERLALKTSPALPQMLPPAPEVSGAVALEELHLKPALNWDRGFYSANRQPGEAGASAALVRFIDLGLASYKEGRDRPGLKSTSMLSSALHFGEISVQALAQRLFDHAHEHAVPGLLTQVEHLVRELGWRDFSYHLLYHYPHTPSANLNAQFDAFPWAWGPPDVLERWQRGQTGIPIVDAGMRELWQTGFMHNRVRMIVASFLTKNLNIHWQAGARWFWDTLTDADLANNTQGWQWAAGSGADAQPYFRIFNPVSQGERFDPEGHYVRRFVPELDALPNKTLHSPWIAPRASRTQYPEPLVDLKESRAQALSRYAELRGR